MRRASRRSPVRPSSAWSPSGGRVSASAADGRASPASDQPHELPRRASRERTRGPVLFGVSNFCFSTINHQVCTGKIHSKAVGCVPSKSLRPPKEPYAPLRPTSVQAAAIGRRRALADNAINTDAA